MRVAHGEGPLRKVRGQTTGADPIPSVDPKAPEKSEAGAAANDRIEISRAARGLHTAQTGGSVPAEAAHAAQNTPAERTNLEIVRKRIQTGYYETKQVTQEVTDRLLELLGLKRPE